MKINVSEVRKKASGAFSKCLAECCFLSLMDSGIKCFVFVLIVLVGLMTNADPFESSVSIFDRFPLPFIAASAIILFASYLLASPLFFGIRWFFWQASGDKGVMPISSVFACYSDRKTIFRCIFLRLKMDLSRLLPATVLGGTVVLALVLGNNLLKASSMIAVKIAVTAGSAVIIIGVILLLLADSVKHILVGFIMASNPDCSAKEILAISAKTVNKSYSSMLRLYLSLIGWMSSCLLVFPVLFVKPFMLMITAIYFRESLADDDDASGKVITEEKELSLV